MYMFATRIALLALTLPVALSSRENVVLHHLQELVAKDARSAGGEELSSKALDDTSTKTHVKEARNGEDARRRGIGEAAPRRALLHVSQPKDAEHPNIHAAKEPGEFGIVQGFRPDIIIPKNKIPLWQKKYMDYHRYHMATGAQNRIYERMAYVQGKASERRRGEQLKLGINPNAPQRDITPKMRQTGQLSRRIGLPQAKQLAIKVGATQAELCRTKSPTNPTPTWCEMDEHGNIIPNPMHTLGTGK
mmetsp:Transcript_7282/g.14844  ORF Transcript_7282/g.14844 Transcript_7282/m.14844 type:complete len:247 (-) Transcript_7282:485-1225(-)